MQPTLPYALEFWSGAITLGVAGLLLLTWALFWDRPRGRRRCPRCSYDMSETRGLTCPECGRNAKHERTLHRTRRNWKAAAGALVLIAVGLATAIVPYARSPQWHRFAPTTLLIAEALPSNGDPAPAVEGELALRLQNTIIWEWQQKWITARAARHLRTASKAEEALRALRTLGNIGPSGANATPEVVALLDHPDEIVRIIAWGVLARIGIHDADSVRLLNDMLTDPASDSTIRQRVTNRLEDNGAASAPTIASLVQIIQRPELHAANNGFIIGGAAMTLGAIGPAAAEALPTLRAVAADESRADGHRYASMLAIALITRDAKAPLLHHARMLGDPDVRWRRQAVNHLSGWETSRDGKNAIPALLVALGDEDAQVREGAQTALTMMLAEDPSALTTLERISHGGDAGLARSARQTIARGGQSAGAVRGLAGPIPTTTPTPRASSPSPVK